MQFDTPAAYFNAVVARGREPRLVHDVGTWQIDVDDAGTWSIHVDHGALQVSQGPGPTPTARVRLSREEFMRLVRGDAHENIVTALLRGEIRELDGDLAFAQKINAILPLFDRKEPVRQAAGK